MPLKVNKDIDESINLTPMIDVVFFLIIFFMVGARFGELNEIERNIPLEVPAVSDASALTSAPSKRVINVLANGQVVLDEKNVTVEQLQTELTTAISQYQKLGVVVRGDGNAKHQRVAEVLAACRQANISDLNISVRIARANSGGSDVNMR